MSISYFTNSNALKLAYVHTKSEEKGETLPALVFLEGFKSDMNGSKALFLEEQCRRRGQEFLRFDYSGHGYSEGEFVDGTIGAWLQDAREIIGNVIKASEVMLVGSSMGGWISLRLLIDQPEKMPKIAGVVGIAAAPDFTKDVKTRLSSEQLIDLEEKGYAQEPSGYDEPYIFTRELFEDGKKQCLLDPLTPYKIDAALTLLQGKKDDAVHWKKALRIEKVFDGPRTEVFFIDDGDHSLSRSEDLERLDEKIFSMLDYLRE